MPKKKKLRVVQHAHTISGSATASLASETWEACLWRLFSVVLRAPLTIIRKPSKQLPHFLRVRQSHHQNYTTAKDNAPINRGKKFNEEKKKEKGVRREVPLRRKRLELTGNWKREKWRRGFSEKSRVHNVGLEEVPVCARFTVWRIGLGYEGNNTIIWHVFSVLFRKYELDKHRPNLRPQIHWTWAVWFFKWSHSNTIPF